MHLTERQRQILSYIESQDPAPTARQIAAFFTIGVGTVAGHLQALRKKGCLAPGTRQARNFKVVNSFRNYQGQVLHVPLFGSIPAGFSVETQQAAEGCISVDAKSLGIRPGARLFALRVKGDSMIGKHILHGDFAVLDHDRPARSGDIVAGLIDGESTLKIFQHNRGQPFLRPANPKYPDLFPANELIVQGVLVAIVRRASR